MVQQFTIAIMRGIEFEVVWSDQDVVEYNVTCSNGLFCGASRMYASHDDLAKLADVLSGFPLDAKDSRSVELGTFDSTMAGGGIQMHFFCVDSVGHAIAVTKLRADSCQAMGEPQSVCLSVPVEAGAIDSFLRQAHSLGDRLGAKAYLYMADHTVTWVQRWFASGVQNSARPPKRT